MRKIDACADNYMDNNIPNLKNDNVDPFAEYYLQTEPVRVERAYAWQTAIGLQDVDRLQTTSSRLQKKILKVRLVLKKQKNLLKVTMKKISITSLKELKRLTRLRFV